MAEDARVSFLLKAAASIGTHGNNRTETVLKSYYLMRCRELTNDHGLPDKYFSSKVRCTHCFIEWKRGTETKIKTIKLCKRQKKRIKCYKVTNANKEYVYSRRELLNSKELEQICSFCKHTITMPVLKPSKPKLNYNLADKMNEIVNDKVKYDIKKVNSKITKEIQKKTTGVNVYSNTKDVFSLSNKNNMLSNAVKEQKVIKNNKKKKDKFAGLCQQAVLASAKLKEDKDKQNKLKLFLKPSS